MANILDYLAWRGDLTFAQDPFNEVDNLILSELCFFDFGEIMSEGEILNLGTAAHLFFEKNPKETHRLGLLLSSSFEELLDLAAKSRRFGNTLISHPVNRVEKEPAMQFSATTFSLEDGTVYVAFRGTDDYIVAWKESFSLGIQDEIPGQRAALAYLKNTIAETKCPIRVGGHSKGGNLALFAALHLEAEERTRLVNVYCNDAPGFRKDVRTGDAYLSLGERHISLTPFISIVGALLEHGDDSHVVESDGKGVLQHDAFTWHVMGNRFVRVPSRSQTSHQFEATVRAWLAKLNDGERHAFLETMYQLLTASGAETLSDLNEDKLRASYKIATTLLSLKKETRDVVIRCLAVLFRERKQVLKDAKLQNKDAKKKTVDAPLDQSKLMEEFTQELPDELSEEKAEEPPQKGKRTKRK